MENNKQDIKIGQEKLFTIPETLVYLGIANSTLHKMRVDESYNFPKKIPSIGNKVLFKKSDLDA